MNLGYAWHSGYAVFFSFGRVRCKVRADLRVLMLRRTSCVYRFLLHLPGLRSKCTEGLSTGALGNLEQGTTYS